MLEKLVHAFLSIPGPLAIAAVLFLAAAETALLVGLFIPGEIAVILGGVLAARAHVSLAGVLAASIAGPIIGDSIGYFLGRKYGERLFRKRLRKRWQQARDWIKKRGAPAVAFGRFAAFLRSVVPAAAGAAKMPYRRFLPWNIAAGIVWGTGSALLGYYAGANYEVLVRWMGRISLVLLFAAVAVAAAFFGWKALVRRARHKGHARR